VPFVSATNPETPAEMITQPRRRNRRWVWFFIVTVFLSVLAAAVFIVVNLSLQLTGDELDRAFEKWQQRGPKSYEMRYTVKRGASSDVDVYDVKVVKGEVIRAWLNDLPVSYEQINNYSMTALFRDMKQFMELDSKPGSSWAYTRAVFDEHDGHLRSYVRRVMGGRERVEITVIQFKSQ
jgi:hypothetical protein